LLGEHTSLTYVSRSLIDPATGDEEVARIVELSRRNNAPLNITGALIFSGTHFVQTLEGRVDDVHSLMETISRDPRHTEVTTIRDEPFAPDKRRFEAWSMAYNGRTTYVQRHIDAVTARKSGEPAIRELQKLMMALAGKILL